MSLNKENRLLTHLISLYGKEQAQLIYEQIKREVSQFKKQQIYLDSNCNNKLSERDVILIAYGDTITAKNQYPLRTLFFFLKKYLRNVISIVHILPFFPFSSDDGFSVIDYKSVNKDMGCWDDIKTISREFKLMIDAVINHVSSHNDWFIRFINGDKDYQNYFITDGGKWDLSKVFRPRTSAILTKFYTKTGQKQIWTTFSSDQVDLNYANPEVLLEIIKTLLFYIRKGAQLIRLDAIAFLWKESGTTCIHLPQTHKIIKIIRIIIEMTAPYVNLITETNVPHEENISYFGEINEKTGITDEANMVYQFPLAPLVLHTLLVGSSKNINNWIDGLRQSGIFINFIASHDGIGLMPAKGLITEEDINRIIECVIEHGGLVSFRSNSDGTKEAYEINTTLYDALNNPKHPNPQLDIKRFIASQVIMITLKGVPGIYFNSLFGFRNSLEGYLKTGRARSINRKGVDLTEIEEILSIPDNVHHKIFQQYKKLLEIRTKEIAFHPTGRQKVVNVSNKIFALERESPDKKSKVVVILNLSSDEQKINLDLDQTTFRDAKDFVDLISKQKFITKKSKLTFTLQPYETIWLKENE